MEFFSIMMSKYASSLMIPTPFVRNDFSIFHLMFADNLIVFSKSTALTATNLQAFLTHFHRFCVIGVNWAKSSIFFSNCPNDYKQMILSMLNMGEGNLPVWYFCVPLSSKRLNFQDCYPLVERVKKKLSGWKGVVLCREGRVDSLYFIYYSHLLGFYYVPSQTVIQDTDRLIRDFFWNQWRSRRYLHAIAWDFICLPIHLEGLGIPSIHGLNQVAMLRQVWNVVRNSPNCWN